MMFICFPLDTCGPMPTTSRSVASLLGLVPAVKAISVQLTAVAAAQHICARILPAAVYRHLQISFIDKEVIVLHAETGAQAAKIRHLAPRLLAALRTRFPELHRVRCEVGLLHRMQTPGSQPRRISPTGQRAWRALAGSLPGGELKGAVERLLHAAPGLDGKDQPLDSEEDQGHARDQQCVLQHLPGETQPAPVAGQQVRHDAGSDRDEHDEADDAQEDRAHGSDIAAGPPRLRAGD
jgi:hypothetical protein